MCPRYDELTVQSGYSYGVQNDYERVVVDFGKPPRADGTGILPFRLWFQNRRLNPSMPKTASVRFFLPEGFSVTGKSELLVDVYRPLYQKSRWSAKEDYCLHFPAGAQGLFRILVEIRYNDLLEPLYLTLVVDAQ